MAMQQCPNGHLYDDTKSNNCPFCGSGGGLNATMPLNNEMPQNNGFNNVFPSTVPIEQGPTEPAYIPPQPEVALQPVPKTMPVAPSIAATTYVDQAINDKGIMEVRGWFVCIDGEKKGMDFKIHGEKNTIGRGSENDIRLDFDTTVSKGVNATITYDGRNNKFFLYQESSSKNNIYLNDQLLLMPVEIKDYDVLEIGKTKLAFRSFCNDAFNWE